MAEESTQQFEERLTAITETITELLVKKYTQPDQEDSSSGSRFAQMEMGLFQIMQRLQAKILAAVRADPEGSEGQKRQALLGELEAFAEEIKARDGLSGGEIEALIEEAF